MVDVEELLETASKVAAGPAETGLAGRDKRTLVQEVLVSENEVRSELYNHARAVSSLYQGPRRRLVTVTVGLGCCFVSGFVSCGRHGLVVPTYTCIDVSVVDAGGEDFEAHLGREKGVGGCGTVFENGVVADRQGDYSHVGPALRARGLRVRGLLHYSLHHSFLLLADGIDFSFPIVWVLCHSVRLPQEDRLQLGTFAATLG